MTKFIITKLPTRATLKLSGVPIVAGVEYDIIEEANFEIENTFGYPCQKLDFFKYKIIKDGLLSDNEAKVDISFDVTVLDNAALNVTESVVVGEDYKFTDVIPLTVNYDRIKINSITGKGLWKVGANVLNEGSILYNYQAKDELIFLASADGSKTNYNEIQFVFGHKEGYYPTVNTLTTDATSDAQIVTDLLNVSIDQFRDFPPYYNVSDYSFQIKNGPESGTCRIAVDTTNYQGMGTNPEDELTINDGTTDTVIVTQGVTNIDATLDVNGYLNFNLSAKQLAPTATAGSIEIQLILINGAGTGIDVLSDTIIITLPIITL